MIWKSRIFLIGKNSRIGIALYKKSLAFTEDFKEGAQRPEEKRRPKFQGK